MARALPRALTAFRPRAAKTESPGTRTAKAERPGKGKSNNGDGRSNSRNTARGSSPNGKSIRSAGRSPLPLPLRLLASLCAFVFMVAFAVVLAHLTLQPSPASVSMAHTNLHPGTTLKAYLDQPALRDAVRQIGGNLLLGVPFGVLVPVVAPRARSMLKVAGLTGIVMLLVEFAQGALITGRAFDIDDVILNTAGALLGHMLLGRRLGRAVHARKVREK